MTQEQDHQAVPGLRALVQRFCDAAEEDIKSASVADLVRMCELECDCEFERAEAAEAKAAELETKNQQLRRILGKALHRFGEYEQWVTAAAEALGQRDPTSAAVLHSLREAAAAANACAEERLQARNKLEMRLLQMTSAVVALWQLLDDIDSLGDSMHPELTPYLTAVQARVSRRYEWMETDGYKLTLKEPP